MTLKRNISGMSAAVFAIALSSHMAFAQDNANDRTSASEIFDEIFVTATKKSDVESVQDVPISVTAFNGDTLDALKVRSLESLSFSSPNVSLDDIGTARGTANFSIRGLGVNSSIPSIDPTVGVFIDGVYLGVNSGVVFDLFDLDSIEVLRGPQGLLFGRNTTGGAVLINTGNPTDEFEYKARIAVEGPIDGDRGGINGFAQAIVSGPIVEGKLNGKIGVYRNDDTGYFKNLATDRNHGEAQTTIVRGALEWTPTTDLSFLAKVERFTSEGDGPSATNRGLFPRDGFTLSIDNEGLYDSDATTASLRTDWDVEFGGGRITNIFGYREYSAITDADIDSTPLFLFHSTTELEQDQISNELRYSGTFGNAEVTTGLYYFNQDVAYTEVRDLPPASPLTFYGGGSQDHTVYGAFGQVDYALSDKFTAIFGLRYSKEEKDAGVTFVRPRSECSVVGATCPTSGFNQLLNTVTGGPGIGVEEPNGFVDSDEWSNLTPKVGFQYFHNDNTQFFGSYTKGFRSGGYNFRITDVPTFLGLGANSFDEETVNAFELGSKFQTEDRRGTLNISAFLTDISDMQREVNLPSVGAGVSQFILNTADATIKGVEAEGRYAVTDNFLLTGNIGLIDAEYDQIGFDISGDGIVNDADLALDIPRVPKATFGVGFIADFDMRESGVIVTRANFQHRDRIAYTDNNFGFVQAIDNLSANITWETPIDGVELSLYGKNLFDEVQVGGDTQLPFGGPQSPAIPGSQNLSNGVNSPFDNNPAVGTFSPLKKGRVVGIELTIKG